MTDNLNMENSTKKFDRLAKAVMEIIPEDAGDLEMETEVTTRMYNSAKKAGFKVKLDDPGPKGYPILTVEGPRHVIENWIPWNYGTSYDMSLVKDI